MSLLDGGASPTTDGLQITVTVPTASRQNPIKEGYLLRFSMDGPYHAVIPELDEIFHMKAMHAVYSPDEPLAVQIFGFSRIETFKYEDDLAIGDTIVSYGNGNVMRGPSFSDIVAFGFLVIYVDAENKTCEVLIR